MTRLESEARRGEEERQLEVKRELDSLSKYKVCLSFNLRPIVVIQSQDIKDFSVTEKNNIKACWASQCHQNE